MIAALDHVQLSMPRGGEGEARDFFVRLPGLAELEKPAPLAKRGGVWVVLPDGRQLHLGVEEPFRPNRKAHLREPVHSLERNGSSLVWDDELAPCRRFYSAESFRNWLEFVEPAS